MYDPLKSIVLLKRAVGFLNQRVFRLLYDESYHSNADAVQLPKEGHKNEQIAEVTVRHCWK